EIRPRDPELLRLLVTVGEKLGQFMEHKQAEEAVHQSEERLRRLLDAALDAVITIDGQGLVTQWNPQAEHIFGWTAAEAQGKNLAEMIIPAGFREKYEEALRHYLETGTGPLLHQRFEMTALHRARREIPVELAIRPVVMKDQVYFTAFVRDITERKQT